MTCIFTLAVVGPSGKEQSKLPPVSVLGWYEPATRVPLFVAPASQSGVPPAEMKSSCPGSLTVNVYLCVEPSSTLARPVRCTVGATLTTLTVCVSFAPVALSESVADADTSELAGPSGNAHWNEPAVSVLWSEPATFVPPVPQSVWTDWTVSWPGSELE